MKTSPYKNKRTSPHKEINTSSICEIVPIEVKKWVESLPLNQRRYVLSLCHLMCASSEEAQSEFLNNYVADGLVSKMLQDRVPQQIIRKYLKRFHLDIELNELVLRNYIQQFYIHSAHDLRTQPDLYLES